MSTERLIYCSICHEKFNDPRILPCSHTYCLRCIQDILSSNGLDHFTCPKNDGAKLPKDRIHQLTVNQTVSDMIEYLNLTTGLIPCSNCDATESVYWCDECKKSYCMPCCQQIHEIKAFENHQIVPIKQKPIELLSCEIHTDEKLKYWCLQCNSIVCSDCLLNAHYDHPYTLISRLANDLHQEVDSKLSVIESSLKNNVNETRNSITSINDNNRQQINLIIGAMQFLRTVLDEHEEELSTTINNIDQDNIQLMENFRMRLEYEMQCLEDQKKTLEILQSSKDPMKIIRAQQGFKDYIDRVSRMLHRLELPAKHDYHINGIDQIQAAREKILACGEFIEGVKRQDENMIIKNEALKNKLADYTTEQEWNFEKVYLTDSDMKMISNELKKNRKVININFSECHINDQGIQYLADALRYNNTLQSLNLYKNEINDHGIQYISEILKDNTTLTTLDLSQNKISDQGIQSFVNMLQQNKALTTVHLSQNHIGDEGAQYIANALQQNNTLNILHLSQNLIGDAGAQYLANALINNTNLTKLNLYWNHIGDIGAQSFAETLERNQILTTLILSRNRIGNDGAKHFTNAIRKNTTLATLSLHENRIDLLTQNYMKNILITNNLRVIINW